MFSAKRNISVERKPASRSAKATAHPLPSNRLARNDWDAPTDFNNARAPAWIRRALGALSAGPSASTTVQEQWKWHAADETVWAKV